MLPYIDIEGSGQGVTEITGSVDGTPAGVRGVVTMDDNTGIRSLTVTNTGASAPNAITARDGVARISDVTAQSLNAGGIGVRATKCLDTSSCTDLTLNNVTAIGGGDGVNVDHSSVVATNVIATGVAASGFVINFGSTASVRNSVVTGTTFSIYEVPGGSTLTAAHSQVIGPIGGAPSCIGTL